VVAAEVRALAETSSRSARSISDQIKDMGAKIAEGDRLAREAGQAFDRILALVVETAGVMETVARAMAEQKAGTDTVLEATQSLRSAAARIAQATAEQATASAEIHLSVFTLLESGAVLAMAQDVQGRAIGDLAEVIRTVARESDGNLEGAQALGKTVTGFRVRS
jgi:methyl-accepting chemotaxis protein